MRLKPISKRQALLNKVRFRQQGAKLGRPQTLPKNPEVVLRNALNSISKDMVKAVVSEIVPLLKELEPEFVADTYAETLQEAFDNLRERFEVATAAARALASEFTSRVDTSTRTRFINSIRESIGVDVNRIVVNEGIEDILVASTRKNVSLIKSIPEKYFDELERIVFDNTIRGSNADSMIDQIVKLNGSTENRARLIARDQTSKLNAALNQKRQQNLGVEEYVWRTAGDSDVRDTHSKNNGKVFRWDSPPADTGHPGEDPQCRCIPQAVIKI